MATTTRTGWSHALREAWSFRAESNPPASAPAAGAPPAAAPAAQGTAAAPAGAPDDNPIKDPRAFLAAYERTKAELASSKAELQKLQDAQLTETQRLAKDKERAEAERDQLREDLRDKVNRYEVQLQANKLGIIDPEAAVKLLDWSSLEYGEDGAPKNVEAALKALLVAKPYLAAQAAPPAPGATNPARNHSQGKLTQADIAKMSPAQINARWTEVKQALAGS